jgi:hypothetical protein
VSASIRLTVALLAAGVALAACGEESPESEPPPSTITTTTTTPPTAPVTTFPADQGAALRAAVTEYENAQGVETLRFEVRNLLLSSVDPNWARFNIAPTLGNEPVFQGGYGVAHFDGTSWNVVDIGTSEVGCPPTEIPAPVRESLQLGCPG